MWSSGVFAAVLLLTGFNSDVFSQTAAGGERTKCDVAKEKCHNDTECFHRIMYIHASCVTGGRSESESCKLQCKTGVLRLFDNPYGREVLETEMDCISTVRQEIQDCNLDPKGLAHCTLAQSICELDPTCRRLLDQYESRCDGRLSSSNCPSDCAEFLRAVLTDRVGVKFANCACWRQDPLCHYANALIDPCREAAAKLNSTTTTLPPSTTRRTFDYKTASSPRLFVSNQSGTPNLDAFHHNLGVPTVTSGVILTIAGVLLGFIGC